jgi:Pyruvate/2-oxoacid:ferredoxin oxidoreductase gamma subunit
MMGTGFRQAFQWMESERDVEIAKMAKQRGIMRRIVDSNVRLMAQGWNKLIEEWKANMSRLKEKMRFIIAALTDKDKAFLLCGYNGMKQRCLMLNGIGMGDADMKKIQLIKRLTNQGYNMQVMAANALREFLASERRREEAARLEYERQQREKNRILKRIMDSNVRMMGTGFRQAFQWMENERDSEIAKMAKQRGIMRRMVDSNVRLMSQGWNKLLEQWKGQQAHLKEKMRFIIAAMGDSDKAYLLCGYNGLKQRALMLNGVGMGDAQMKKIQLIKRLTNKGYNLQVMAANCLQEFLTFERNREEAERL